MTEIDYVVDGKRGWELAWRDAGWRARRRVKRAMWRGEAIDHPILAALVVGLVRRTRDRMTYHYGLEKALLHVEGQEEDIRTVQLANAEEQNLEIIARHQAAGTWPSSGAGSREAAEPPDA